MDWCVKCSEEAHRVVDGMCVCPDWPRCKRELPYGEPCYAQRVRGFMQRFEQPVGEFPEVPADEIVRSRCRIFIEEAFELLEACFEEGPPYPPFGVFKERLFEIINAAPVKVDLVAYADANADIRYVATGNDAAAGIDGEEIDRLVADSNDTKSHLDPVTRKVVKGERYKPPNVAAELRRQGWNG